MTFKRLLDVLLFAVAFSTVLLGCASYSGSARSAELTSVAAEPGWKRVRGVPAVAQRHEKGCGPAALSAVLRFWGLADDVSVIDRTLRRSSGGGVRARDLKSYAESRALSAYVFHGSFADLRRELNAGRPAIVGLLKPLSSGKALAHYEVVVGYHPERHKVLTMDPALGFRENSLAGFLDEWQAAHQVMLVVFPPAQ